MASWIRWLDEAEDPHRAAAPETGQWIDLPYALDQRRPALAGLPGSGRGRAVDLEDAGSFIGIYTSTRWPE